MVQRHSGGFITRTPYRITNFMSLMTMSYTCRCILGVDLDMHHGSQLFVDIKTEIYTNARKTYQIRTTRRILKLKEIPISPVTLRLKTILLESPNPP